MSRSGVSGGKQSKCLRPVSVLSCRTVDGSLPTDLVIHNETIVRLSVPSWKPGGASESTMPHLGHLTGDATTTAAPQSHRLIHSGGPGGPAERYSWLETTEQRMVTGGGIGRYSVSYAARSRGVTDGKPISEDAEGTRARAPGAPGGTYDDKGALV